MHPDSVRADAITVYRHSMGGGSLGRKYDVVEMQHIEFDHLLYMQLLQNDSDT